VLSAGVLHFNCLIMAKSQRTRMMQRKIEMFWRLNCHWHSPSGKSLKSLV